MAGPMKPSDPNNTNGGGDNKKGSFWGFGGLVVWALLLVMLLRSCVGSASAPEQVDYSTFYNWVERGCVEEVEITSTAYLFTVLEDSGVLEEYAQEQEEAREQARKENPWSQPLLGEPSVRSRIARGETITFSTAPVSQYDLPQWLARNGVTYRVVQAGMGEYLASLFVSVILPTAVLVAAMVFLFRYMSKKVGPGGGIGGIGGVGKANATV